MRLLPTLTQNTANFSITWEGHEIGFSAKRGAVSPMLAQRFVDVEKNPMEMAYALTEILDRWDIEDVDCKDPQQVGALPIEFLTLFVEKIAETFAGNAPKPTHSQSGSAA